MDREGEAKGHSELEKIFRSDILPQFASVIDLIPALAPLFPKLIQVRMVVDANRVQGELRWRLRKRREVSNRSALHEAIMAGVVVPYVPDFLHHEIEKHYEDIARQTGTSVADVQQEWEEFKKYLVFYVPKSKPDVDESYADVNDFPYLATWRELDAQAIYTTDRHLVEMGAPVISVLIDLRLRDYARASAVQMGIGFGSTFAVLVGLEALQMLYRLLVKVLAVIMRLPPTAQLVLIVAAAMCVAHPKSREKMKELWTSWKTSPATRILFDVFLEFASQYADATAKARKRRAELRYQLPLVRKRKLVYHARSVCVEAGCALSLVEIERRIQRGGYTSRSKTFLSYLRRVVRADDSFIEVQPGFWKIRTA